MANQPHFKVLKSERKHDGKVFNLIVDEIEYGSGTRALREVVEHPGGAIIVPMLDANTVLLVRQFRYPTKEYLYELPAGRLGKNEYPMQCAARELKEETGYHATSLDLLTAIYTTPGFCTEKLYIYLATQLARTVRGQQLEEGEHDLTVHPVSLNAAVEMIERGEIADGKTICGILLADRHLKKK